MRIMIAMFLGALGGCASVHSVYMTNLRAPETSGTPIQVEVQKRVVLGFNFDNDYVFEARQELIEKCGQGLVTGVLSTYETYSYVIFTDHVVRAEAVCVAAPEPEPSATRDPAGATTLAADATVQR